MCEPKRVGPLRVREPRLVNLAILGKWHWRLLSKGEGLWKAILVAKYRVVRTMSHRGGREHVFRVASSWWKDILLVFVQRVWMVGNLGSWVRGVWVWGS
ncbi:ribonuclease H protein [Trifolium medium]|uniref:Ribonuclease H protein n=1 Tax=Trifolium medium TaxID=97028 RepID=A0A392QBE1_9FABA|nr:ribonuclease H protein [Trifolium medium]